MTAVEVALLEKVGESYTQEVISVQLQLLDLMLIVYNVYRGTMDTRGRADAAIRHPRQCAWWVETSTLTTVCCNKSPPSKRRVLNNGESTHIRYWISH